VTRALGDSSMKEFIIGAPYTTRTEIGGDNPFLILACDGVRLFLTCINCFPGLHARAVRMKGIWDTRGQGAAQSTNSIVSGWLQHGTNHSPRATFFFQHSKFN